MTVSTLHHHHYLSRRAGKCSTCCLDGSVSGCKSSHYVKELIASVSSSDNKRLQALLSSSTNTAINYQDKAGNTPLLKALQAGSLDCVRSLLAVGAAVDVNAQSKAGMNCLLYCVKEGLNDLAASLIANDKVITSVRDADGNSALHLACLVGDFDIANKLTAANKGLINATNNKMQTPITMAVKGWEKFLRVKSDEPLPFVPKQYREGAIDAGFGVCSPSIAASPGFGLPSLKVSSAFGGGMSPSTEIHTLQSIVGSYYTIVGADDSDTAKDDSDDMSTTDPFRCVRKLLGRVKSNEELRYSYYLKKQQVFASSTDCDSQKIVQMLIDTADTNLNGVVHNSNVLLQASDTALMTAIRSNLKDCAMMLIRSPTVDLNSLGEFGFTALHTAIVRGMTDVAHAILDRVTAINHKSLPPSGFGDNDKDVHEVTPLMLCAANSNVEILQRLLTFPDIEVNIVSNTRGTALLCAVKSNSRECVKLLLERADIDVNAAVTPRIAMGFGMRVDSSEDETPLLLACKKGCIDIVKWILEKESVNYQSSTGLSPLMVAVRSQHVELIETLLEYEGINIGATNTSGMSAVEIALEIGNEDIIAILLPGNQVKSSHHHHALLDATNRRLNHSCDVCRAPTILYYCRRCDWDICRGCFEQETIATTGTGTDTGTGANSSTNNNANNSTNSDTATTSLGVTASTSPMEVLSENDSTVTIYKRLANRKGNAMFQSISGTMYCGMRRATSGATSGFGLPSICGSSHNCLDCQFSQDQIRSSTMSTNV